MHSLNTELVLEAIASNSDGVDVWRPVGTLWAAMNEDAIIIRSAPEGSPRRPRVGQRFRRNRDSYEVIKVEDIDGRYLACEFAPQ